GLLDHERRLVEGRVAQGQPLNPRRGWGVAFVPLPIGSPEAADHGQEELQENETHAARSRRGGTPAAPGGLPAPGRQRWEDDEASPGGPGHGGSSGRGATARLGRGPDATPDWNSPVGLPLDDACPRAGRAQSGIATRQM